MTWVHSAHGLSHIQCGTLRRQGVQITLEAFGDESTRAKMINAKTFADIEAHWGAHSECVRVAEAWHARMCRECAQ